MHCCRAECYCCAQGSTCDHAHPVNNLQMLAHWPPCHSVVPLNSCVAVQAKRPVKHAATLLLQMLGTSFATSGSLPLLTVQYMGASNHADPSCHACSAAAASHACSTELGLRCCVAYETLCVRLCLKSSKGSRFARAQ